MAAKIRLTREGKRSQAYYRIIVIDESKRRDGKYLDRLGTYNPHFDPPSVVVDRKKLTMWLEKGALVTRTVSKLVGIKSL